jgi:NDP-sugar pyrophosphorylase family protein
LIKYDVIILSGGKGLRVSKLTKKTPKCLIDINGKPFLYHQLKYLQKYRIKNVILSVGYLSNKINAYVDKEIDFLNIKIVNDGNKLLGTGGAIMKSLDLLKEKFFVIYGDSYLNFNLNKLKSKSKFSSMAIFKNDNKYDLSNVDIKKSRFIFYNKTKTKNDCNYIDYGVSYLNKSIFKNEKRYKKFDLSLTLNKASKKNQLKGLIVKKRFYEIGSYDGIKQLKNFLKK